MIGRILVAGEINVDLILQGCRTFPAPGREVLVDDCVLTLGSSSAICAMGLARLGEDVAFVGKAGLDPWGDHSLLALAGAGIDVSRVVRDGTLRTGVTVSITSPRERALVSFAGSIAALCSDDVGDDALAGFRHLHVSSYFLQEGLRPGCRELFARAHALGLTTSLDPGFDPREGWDPDLAETLAEVDVFLPNEVELRAITGRADLCESLRRLRNGRTLTVAKLGEGGAAALDGEDLVRVPAFPVQAIDTTGAGDSFNAGFLHAWLRGRPLEECLRYGCACGGLSTRGLGGASRQATADEVESLLAGVP